jgi:hypothetical protein
MTRLKNLCVGRRAMMGQDGIITHVSVREVNSDSKRRVLVDRYNQKGSITADCANADGAALIRYSDLADFHSSIRPLRGVPQTDYESNANGQPVSAEYSGGIKAFFLRLIAGEWGWLRQGTQVSADITAVTGGAGFPAIVTMAGNPLAGKAVGSHIRGRIRGVEGATQLNGGFVGKVIDANHLSIPRILVYAPYTTNTGKVVLQGPPTFAAVADYTFEGFDERKTGRPFFQQRGRRSARRSL